MPPHPHTPETEKNTDPLSLLVSRIREKQVAGFHIITQHTKMVMTAKWGMVMVSLLLIAMLFVLPMTVPKEAAMQLAFSNVPLASKDKPVMKNPRFEGISSNHQPFTVMAKHAVQRDETLIDLENIQADVGLSNKGRWMNMTANQGVYDRVKKYLWLRDDIILFFDDGHEVRTRACDMDMQKNIAQGAQEITVESPMGSLRADQFRIEQISQRAFFTGNVRVVLYLNGRK